MLTVDGSQGEGGGQVLRTSLALSIVTGQPFRIDKIRANRRKPGLARQHLTAVEAAAAVSGAEVEGAAIGSRLLTFRPGPVRAGEYSFSVGTAGSATLVLQAVLPTMLTAPGSSTIHLEGGTHNPFAPPFDFLRLCFAPMIERMGAQLRLELERPGFYPAGGGLLHARIEPPERLRGFELLERGELLERRVTASVAGLPESIADRELETARRELGWDRSCFDLELIESSRGPGNVLTIEMRSEHVTEVVTGFGMRGTRAETVAIRAARAASRYLSSGAPVGPNLADQLMLPLALAGEGRYRTLEPTAHARTNAAVIRHFLETDLAFIDRNDGTWEIRA
jgi:RNA 3'-terminal phosphate cyclase (ATP)